MARHQLTDGRQAAARGEGTGSRPHILDNTLAVLSSIMSNGSNATTRSGGNATRRSGAPLAGVLLGALGVIGFSFSLPATRLALRDLDPWVVAFGRAVVAPRCGGGAAARRARRARPRAQWRSLAIVAAGVVIGFPLLTSLALHHRTAAHGAIVVGLRPPRPP